MSGIVLLIIIVGVCGYGVAIYNGLISRRVMCDNAWSQIDVQLKRRHDLIPNLMETVKGYAAHEKEALERVVQARNAALSAQGPSAVSQSENMLTGALRQIFALSESYPDLKANQNFMQLQEEIATTENKISFARQHYNDSVNSYNSSIQQFPANFIVGFGNFPPRVFWVMDGEEAKAAQVPPTVSFS